MGGNKVIICVRMREAVAQHPSEFKTDGKVLRCIPFHSIYKNTLSDRPQKFTFKNIGKSFALLCNSDPLSV